jgi:hypothetical protein
MFLKSVIAMEIIRESEKKQCRLVRLDEEAIVAHYISFYEAETADF